jgi:hypothetical protein
VGLVAIVNQRKGSGSTAAHAKSKAEKPLNNVTMATVIMI